MQYADLRTQLEELGLSQSGLARTLILYNDPREFDVILRWVQRAVAGGIVDNVPYLKVIMGMMRGNMELRAGLRYQLARFNNGEMHSYRNTGHGQEDVTSESIEDLERRIRDLDRLLVECRMATADKQRAAARPPTPAQAATRAAPAWVA